MNLLIDTNRYSDLAAGRPDVVDFVASASLLAFPFVVLAELQAAFLSGTRRDFNEQALAELLGSPGTAVLFADARTIDLYARVHRDLRQIGRLIPTHDLWIAALALQHNLPLYTRDAHFTAVAGLTLV